MAVGVFFDGFSSTTEMLEVCHEAELAGASSLWFAQHMGYREAVVSATAAARLRHFVNNGSPMNCDAVDELHRAEHAETPLARTSLRPSSIQPIPLSRRFLRAITPMVSPWGMRGKRLSGGNARAT
jgi:hypothetical protein